MLIDLKCSLLHSFPLRFLNFKLESSTEENISSTEENISSTEENTIVLILNKLLIIGHKPYCSMMIGVR